MAVNFLLALAMIEHILCGITDCLLAYTPNGRFDFNNMKDNEKMSKTFENMPLKNIVLSMLLGVLAFSISIFGYLALCNWMKQFSNTYATIMFVSIIIYFIFVTAHHVFCGVTEWFYVRLGRTKEALEVIIEFFKKTSITMYITYLGLFVFSIAFFIAVVSGVTSLPRWACVFNTFPIFLVIAPSKLPAKGNIAGAIMFLGLLFVI